MLRVMREKMMLMMLRTSPMAVKMIQGIIRHLLAWGNRIVRSFLYLTYWSNSQSILQLYFSAVRTVLAPWMRQDGMTRPKAATANRTPPTMFTTETVSEVSKV